MVSDDERRRVAERLRGEVGCGSSWPGMERLGVILGVEGGPGFPRRFLSRLADLIDPDCEEGRYSVARTVRPVDREALLELSEDVTEAAAMATAVDASKGAEMLAEMLLDIARRIREALGVSDD